MPNSLKDAQDLNKAIAARQRLLQAQTLELQKQAAHAMQMQRAISGLEFDDDVIDKLNKMNEAIEKGAEVGEEWGETLEEKTHLVAEKLIDVGENTENWLNATKRVGKKFPATVAIATAALDGLVSGLRTTVNVLASIGNVAVGALSWLVKIGKSIISIPFKILDGLIGMATAGAGAPELMQAFEDLRKEFGSFRQDVSKNVISAAKGMQREMTGTGLSVWRVFGKAADRLKFFTEMAKDLGSTMHVVGSQIAEAGKMVGELQKGLGLAGEEMKGMAELAIRSGKPLVETMVETAHLSQQMGEAFGISDKTLSKAIGSMVKDVKNFGSVTQKVMVANAVFAKKLGVEFDKLLGVVDQFDTFEDAAVNAAQLAQAFGANVDAFELMNEQDPAKRIDSLRKAMKAAGRDASTMSRQELKLLAATTGMDEATVKQVFSLKNQGVAYEDVQKKAEEAAKAQKELPIIMKRLAESIERIVRSGQMAKKGFFQTFIDGFKRGIKGMMGWNFHASAFGKIMWNIRRALRQTYWAGVRVGKNFTKMFPAVEKLFGAIAEFFEPGKFGKMLNGVIDAFSAFFKDVANPKVSPEKMMQNLFDRFRKAFTSFFSGQSNNGKKMMEGIAAFGKAIVKILAGIIPLVGKGLANILDVLTGFLQDPGKLGGRARVGASAAASGLAKFLNPLLVAMKKFWVIAKPSIVAFFGVLWKKIKEHGGPLLNKFGPWLLGVMFGPAVFKGALAAIGFGLARVFRPGAILKLFSRLHPAAAIGAAALGINEGMQKYREGIEKEMGPGSETHAKLASGAAGLINALTFGLVPPDLMQKMANAFGSISKSLFGALKNFAGENFGKSVQDWLAGQFDILGGLGGMIKGIFKGDDKAVEEGMIQFGKGLINTMWAGMKLVLWQLPSLFWKWVLKAFDMLQRGLLGLASKGLKKIEHIPIIGPIAKLLRKFVDFAKNTVSLIAKTLGGIFDWALGKKDPFKSLGKSWKGFVDSLKSLARTAMEWMTWPFRTAQEYAKKAADGIISIFKTAGKLLLAVITGDVSAIKGIWNKVKGFFSGFVNTNIVKPFSGIWAAVKKPLEAAWTSITDGFKGIGKTILGFFKKVFSDMVKAIIAPALNTLQTILEALPGETAKNAANSIKAFKKAWEISSPSKVMVGIGSSMVQGLQQGMETGTKKNAGQGLTDMLINTRSSIKPMADEYALLGNSIQTHMLGGKSKAGPVAAMRKIVRKLVKEINEVSKELNKAAKGGRALKPALEKIANPTGLGGSDAFTINHKRFAILVRMDVKIEAEKLETVLLGREGTQFARVDNS